MQTLIKSSDSFKSLKQRFDELLKANSQLAETVRSEALKHIELDNLSQNVFTVSKYGIQIQYRNPDGTPLKYKSKKAERIMAARKTVAYNTETEYQFCRYRIAPSLIEAGNFDLKYYSPSKHETGISSAAFFTDTAIQRFKDSKQGGTLFIPEGEKKADALSRYDLAAVGFGGITMFHLDTNLMQWIKRCNPDNIALIYDADYYKLGKHNKFARPTQFLDSAVGFFTEVKQFCKSDNIPVPEFFICVGKNDADGKGIDDVLLNTDNKDLTLKALNNLQSNPILKIDHIPNKSILSSCKAFFGVLTDSRKYCDRVFSGNTGEYLTTVADRHNLQYSDFKNKVIISPVGSGKSTLIREFGANECTVVAVPTNALQRDFKREAEKQNIDIFIFNSDTYKKECETTEIPVSGRRFIVTTYHSFDVLLSVLGNDVARYNLIIDEAHNFTSSAKKDFLYWHLFSMLHSFKFFQSVTLFTATDLPVFAPELQLEKFIFDIPSNIERRIQFFEKGKNQYCTAAKITATTSNNGALPLIVLNNKKDGLKRIKSAMKPYRKDVKIFNADTKAEAHHKQLLNSGSVDAECIISTSVIKEGVNIYDLREHVVLIVLSPLHAVELEQFAARFRLAKSVTIIVLIDSEKVNWEYSFSFANTVNIEHNKALAHCKFHNMHDITERQILGKLSKQHTDGKEAVYFDSFTHEWNFCPLLLANEVFRTESERQRINPFLMLQYLKRYGWQCPDITPENEKPIIRDIRADSVNSEPDNEPEDSKTELELFMEAVEILEKSADPIETAQTGENEFFQLYMETVEAVQTPEQALQILKETEGIKKNINTLKRRLRFKDALAELVVAKKTKGRKSYLTALKTIIETFCTAEPMTAAELREHYIRTVSGTEFFQNTDLSQMRNDKVIKNLTRFMEYSKERIKRDGKTVCVYVFSPVSWL